MHQPTEDHRTAKDLSPEELAEYRRRLDQHLQNRKVDEALLQRAWQTAHRVAAMLYEDFGVTHELDYQKTEQKAKQVSPVFDIIFTELDVFVAYLKKQEND